MEFAKMHGAGNDFILIDNTRRNLSQAALSHLAKTICTRRISLGADGLISVRFLSEEYAVSMQFFNADGSIGEMCGNGARCLVRYAAERYRTCAPILIQSPSGNLVGQQVDEKIYRVDLNPPTKIVPRLSLTIQGETFSVGYAELGTPPLPHALVWMGGLAQKNLQDLYPIAKKIRHHSAFPKGANVNFYEILDDKSITLRTFERGVEDFTLACGTGSGAAAAILWQRDELCNSNYLFHHLGGDLSISLTCKEEQVDTLSLTGEAAFVARGNLVDFDERAFTQFSEISNS